MALLSGIGTGLMTPAVNAAVGDLITAHHPDADGGPALAGFQLIGDIGAVLGPIVAGLVVEQAGYGVALATVAIIAAASFASWLQVPATAVQ